MELFVQDLTKRGINTGLDLQMLDRAVREAGEIFPQ